MDNDTITIETTTKVCKNKKCQKILPQDYKHLYCEACRNKQADTAKKIVKGVGVVALSAASIAVTIITGGKINLKEH